MLSPSSVLVRDSSHNFILTFLLHIFILGRFTDIKTTKKEKQGKAGNKSKGKIKRAFVDKDILKWRPDENGVLEIPYLFDGKRKYLIPVFKRFRAIFRRLLSIDNKNYVFKTSFVCYGCLKDVLETAIVHCV